MRGEASGAEPADARSAHVGPGDGRLRPPSSLRSSDRMSPAPEAQHDWLDEDAGPVVRPYTVTGGRVRPVTGGFDLMAFVLAAPGAAGSPDAAYLQPEHRAILAMAEDPVSVAELAAGLNLVLGVVRVLLGDLLATGLIAMHEPSTAAHFPEDDVLQAVVNGLRAL